MNRKEQIIVEKKEENQWTCKHGNTLGMDWCDKDTCKDCSEAVKKEDTINSVKQYVIENCPFVCGDCGATDWASQIHCPSCRSENYMRRVNVLWFSRHKMTVEQRNALHDIVGEIFVDMNIHQIDKQIKHASELQEEIKENDIIAIVAPLPLQQEFLKLAEHKPVIFCKNKRVISEDGSKAEFVFDGWYRLKKIEIETEQL